MNDNRSILQFKKYIVEKLDFKYNLDYNNQGGIEISYNISPELITVDDDSFVLKLFVEVFPENEECSDIPFNLKLEMTGFFKFIGEADIKKYRANAAAILFPYVRSLVTTITANANIAPLVLPTINTLSLFEE